VVASAWNKAAAFYLLVSIRKKATIDYRAAKRSFHTTGGGAYNDRTVGNYNDITEQLVGDQFTCGDIVTYLLKIEVEDNPVHTNQTIEMDMRFLGDSTGQSGAGLIDIVGAGINYGMVENGDNGTGRIMETSMFLCFSERRICVA
jgi:hypothetical protein